MVQPVADRINGDAVGAAADGQLVDAPLQPRPDEGDGIIRLHLFDEDVAHLVVGTVVLDLVDEFVFHNDIHPFCMQAGNNYRVIVMRGRCVHSWPPPPMGKQVAFVFAIITGMSITMNEKNGTVGDVEDADPYGAILS